MPPWSRESGWPRRSGATSARKPCRSERLAEVSSPALVSILFAVAADRHLACGDRPAGPSGGRAPATQADPTSARSIAVLAEAVLEERDRAAAAALERAIALVGPRATWCRALAEALDALGEAELAVGWSQRCVALRPGDRDAILALIARLLAARDPWRLGDALAWLLSQPQPVSWLAEPFARALRELARLDPDRAAVVARRTLDVLGPEATALRDAMFDVAAKANDDAFAAAIFERWLSCGAEGADRSALYVTLADLRQRLGDDEAEARVVARAVREGLATAAIDAHLEWLAERPATPDAQLWRMEAKAARLVAGDDTESAAWAWRELGAAIWDLAGDRERALEAWTRAARATGTHGYTTLALDLIAFSDPETAFEWLRRTLEAEDSDAAAGAIAIDAARAALSIAEFRVAFDFAARGVARCPSRADALEMAERAATQTSDQAALSGLYELVASKALGRFGRRAAHYRGARFFERRGEHGLALKHAAQAFYAVPSEGSSFQLLARAAERAGDRAQAVHTVEQVAERSERSEARTAWLLRAASIAGEGEEGARRRVDVLLRAAVSSPSVAVIALLRDAGRDLLRFGPEEREVLEMRLERAALAMTDRLGGPDGARVAIAFARTSLELFSDAESAMSSLERAFACDGDVDEFADLAAWGSTLGSAQSARERTAALLASAETAHANIGIPALRLLSAIAMAVGDGALQARTVIAAALREPEDDALAIEADAAARAAPELEERLAKRVPRSRRAEALIVAARGRVADGAHAEAASLLERAIELTDEPSRPALELELRAAWDAAGRSAEIEARVQRDAASEAATPSARADHWTEIADRRETRGDKAGAVRALTEACKLDPEPLERWSALERVAEAAGDDATRVTALEAIAMRVGSRGRVAVFRRLAHAHERRNDAEAAERAWQRVLALDAEDEEADHAVEAAIVERGRYDELAEHLARRADRLSGQSEKKEMLRAVRLRRAAILEQRLGRLDEACDELSLLLAEWPNSPGALRYLADLLERRGEPARAAPLWQRAAALETDPVGRDELELRAGRAALASGDTATALMHASRISANGPAHQASLELRVEVARRLGDDKPLGDALEALAVGEAVDPPDTQRVAARSSAVGGARRGSARRAGASHARRRGGPGARHAAASGPGARVSLARRGAHRTRPGEPSKTWDAFARSSRARTPLSGHSCSPRRSMSFRAEERGCGSSSRLARRSATTRCSASAWPSASRPWVKRRRRSTSIASPSEARCSTFARGAAWRCTPRRRPCAPVATRTRRTSSISRRPIPIRECKRRRCGRACSSVSRRRRPKTRRSWWPPEPIGDSRSSRRPCVSRRTPSRGANARLALGRARLDLGDAIGAEPLLWEALADGLVEAGDALAPVLSSTPDRGRDVVRLRRQQVSLEPGDVGRLELLRAAALADDDRVYGRAVEHVLRAFDPGAGPLPPPPLVTQPEQSGIFALLDAAAASRDTAGDALAALWESSTHLFARDTSTYEIPGLERVVPGPTSAVARLYEVALRLLDVPKMPLYLTRSIAGSPAVQVALVSPPSVLLGGDVREESTALRFAMGWGLSAALSRNVLRLGVSPGEGSGLVDAIRAAFGPPEIGRRVDAHAARLAQSFWQTVPARTQRRLQELLGGGAFPDHTALVARADQSGRRVGMFLAGDFAGAARQVVAESHVHLDPSRSLDNLRSLCEELPALADLLRLAVSPEYAEARWHVVAPASQRGMLSSGRFSVF